MAGPLLDLFASENLMPHGQCYLWRNDLIGLHVGADAVIALAYYSIPVALAVFVARRQDLAYHWIFTMFALFIMACGTTHAMNIWTLWHPDYGLSGMVKAGTALVSLATAVVLWPMLPKALALPSPEQLRAANAELAGLNRELEARVATRTAELRRSNAELERFAYVASHDLKEPLNTARSFLELLQRRATTQLDERNLQLVERAVAATERMQTQIHALLNYSRAGREEAAYASVDLAALANDVGHDLHADLEAVGGRYRVEGRGEVATDRELLRTVLQNLVVNAVKYRGQRPLDVVVRVEPWDRGLALRVRDNGIGIAPEHHERIFEMFQRLHRNAEIAGTGMGLAIARRLIEHLGGTIQVESTPGEGSDFAIWLPADRQAGKEPQA